MTTPSNRLLTLIMLLQRQPNQKAADLAEQLGVSVRTVHRYFSMLEEIGIPLYSERGPQGGFSLVRGYKMPPLIFTPEEAVAIYLGASLVKEMWGKLYQESAHSAMAKLDNVLPEEQIQEINWARRSLAASGMHRSDLEKLAPILQRIRLAIREQYRLEIQYQSSHSPHPTERLVNPYALIYRWGWWYLVGFCQLRQEIRSFRIDRIQQLELTDHSFSIPEDFDIQKYLAKDWQSPPQIEARMRFFPEMSHIARYNQSYWDSIQDLPDGSVEVTFLAPTLEWAASNVLAYGPAVKIESPHELRDLVANWSQEISQHYLQKRRISDD